MPPIRQVGDELRIGVGVAATKTMVKMGDGAARTLVVGPVDDGPYHVLLGEQPGDGRPLEDRHAPLPGSGRQRHGGVDRVDPPVTGHVEAGEEIVGPGEREQVGDLGGRDLVDVDTEMSVEGGDPPVLLQPVGIGGQFDGSDHVGKLRQSDRGLQVRVLRWRRLRLHCR